MKYLTTIYDIDNSSKLLTLADGLVVGLKGLSTRETSYLEVEAFKNLSNHCKQLNKALFISLKPMLFNDQVKHIKAIFNELKDTYYSGVIVGDLGYYYLLTEMGVNNIIYHPETLLTNIMDINSFFDVGVKGAFVAKEIRLEDIKRIAQYKKGNIFMTAHGYLNMFYSKRHLLNSYFNETGITYDFLNKETLKLKELKREGLYPIIEDEFGTHIYRKDVTTALYQTDELKDLDYLVIDSIFHDDDYAYDILKLFKNDIDEVKIQQIKDKYNEVWDKGFLFTKTIYKRDKQ